MKRWNKQGSTHARVRMSELRVCKREWVKRDLIAQWQCLTGRRDWFKESGLQMGCGVDSSINWLRVAIANLKVAI